MATNRNDDVYDFLDDDDNTSFTRNHSAPDCSDCVNCGSCEYAFDNRFNGPDGARSCSSFRRNP